MLDINGITKRFFPDTINEKVAISQLSLHLDEGDFVTVIGSNGAGKSTLLNLIAGRYFADVGSIVIDGKDVTKVKEHRRAKQVARVFQDPMLGTAPRLTIEENLAVAFERGNRRGLGFALSQKKRDEYREALRRLDLGLENRLSMRVGMLSGGQRQALSLLMAAYRHPAILLLDEHTAALDPSRAESITRLTTEMVRDNHLTALMVTHNMEQALAVGNRLIMMHEGRIVLDISGEAKRNTTPETLLQEFSAVKGATLSDRTMMA